MFDNGRLVQILVHTLSAGGVSFIMGINANAHADTTRWLS